MVQNTQDDSEIKNLINNINASLKELEIRAMSLPEETIVKLLQMLNIPEKFVNKEIRGILEFDDRSVKGRAKPTVSFLHPPDGQDTQIYTKIEDFIREEPIDIFEKIKEDLGNLKDPFIFAAIQRWAKTISYQHIIEKEDYDIAKRHIERLCEVTMDTATKVIPQEIALSLSIDKVELHYLKYCWELLRSPEIREKRRSQEKMQILLTKLGASMGENGLESLSNIGIIIHGIPTIIVTEGASSTNSRSSLDINSVPPKNIKGSYSPMNGFFYAWSRLDRCLRFIRFLASDGDDVRMFTKKPFDRMTWAALRNSFITWRFSNDLSQGAKRQKDSIRTYLSTGKAKLQNLSDGELLKLSQDALYKYGAFDGQDRSLKNNRVGISFNSITKHLHIAEGLAVHPYKSIAE